MTLKQQIEAHGIECKANLKDQDIDVLVDVFSMCGYANLTVNRIQFTAVFATYCQVALYITKAQKTKPITVMEITMTVLGVLGAQTLEKL